MHGLSSLIVDGNRRAPEENDDLVVLDCPACTLDPPGEAGGLTLAISSGTVADLAWDAQAGAETYDVYRGTARDGTDLACFLTGLTGTSTQDDGLVPSPGEGLYHVVAAVNCAGDSTLGDGRAASEPCP